MMRVHEFRPDFRDDGVEWASWTRDDGGLGRISDHVPPGTPVAESWEPLHGHLRLEHGEEVGDFPNWLDPVFSARAREALADLLDPCGEWLPLVTSNGGDFFIYNVLLVVDAVDEEASRFLRLPSGSGYYGIDRIGFDAGRLPPGETCFRVPQGLTTSFFMTGAVADRIAEAGLTGVAPLLVWDTKHGARYIGL